jgi:hypothetical protein
VSEGGAATVAVVGHVEWIEFARVEQVTTPLPGPPVAV